MVDIATEANKAVVEIAQHRKTEICFQGKGVNDMQSFVVFQHGDLFECAQGDINGHPFETLPYVLNAAFNDGKKKFDTISLVVDSYVRLNKDENLAGYKAGDLEYQYKNNPDTSVVEALTVATYGYHGGSAGKCVKYVYDDNGVPKFTKLGDEMGMESEFVDFVIENFIEFCKKHSS